MGSGQAKPNSIFVGEGRPVSALRCPICSGSGELPGRLKTLPMARRRALTCDLHDRGYNQVEIMRIAGWPSVEGVRAVLAHVKTPEAK
jgi:hypothetical protein